MILLAGLAPAWRGHSPKTGDGSSNNDFKSSRTSSYNTNLILEECMGRNVMSFLNQDPRSVIDQDPYLLVS